MESKELAKNDEQENFYGVSDNISMEDLEFGHISIMQSMSELVQDERAQVGEIWDISSEEKLANKGGEVEVIPLYLEKKWIVTDSEQNVVDMFPGESESEYPFQEEVNGQVLRRTFMRILYCLLPPDLKNKRSLPRTFAFKSSGTKEGKKLATQLALNANSGIASWDQTYIIGQRQKSKDKKKWLAPKVFMSKEAHKKIRDTTPEEKQESKKWSGMLRKSVQESKKRFFEKVKEESLI